jgi:hypothetical protein
MKEKPGTCTRKVMKFDGGDKTIGAVDRRLLSFLRYSFDFELFEEHFDMMG